MTIDRPFDIWVEEGMTEDFRFAVVQKGAIIGRFCKEPHAQLLADTLIRAELIHDLGSNVVDEILCMLVDQISELRSRKWIALPK